MPFVETALALLPTVRKSGHLHAARAMIQRIFE